ncbi:ABC transporter ATP-binding protein [Tenuibacillus multivorans]|uniref:Iron complex transport system ATP-binding protein n=1 Tax=Tenuibacillus multivorans TaxID=237069 RepID=A0A1H0B8F8_9BACI|nr:ABC transporter ATP-binding protein [Tenuibacillus multivorans]GEL78603.1 ABC transporter ATP-binding protein [Tenuibacillus multivorans]SDN41909.1 iron complex transport system ATP-binding protein [Tenuibacillus multivorans]
MLDLQNVSKSIEGKTIVNDITFSVQKGSCVGLIGPNGAGKSTLVKLVSALEKPSGGSIQFIGKDVQDWTVKKLARHIAVLTQGGLDPYPITVFDAVLMGRYPHLGFFERESKSDYGQVDEVLNITGLTDFRDQMLDTLSGGEKQRVAIAKAMVQQPQLLLLDEPTTFLDIGHQKHILKLVKDWQKRDGLTVMMVLHDLNLAAQFCDELVLMDEGQIVNIGTSRDIITSETLEKVYHTNPEIIQHPTLNIPQILL